MDKKAMNLNEIYAYFDSMPKYCPVCGECLWYGVSIQPKSDYIEIFVFCDSGAVFNDSIRHDMIEKRDLDYIMFGLSHDHPKC